MVGVNAMKLNPDDFCKLPIKILLKYGDLFSYDAFLKLSESKIVQVSYGSENPLETIIKYHKEKNVQDIYVTKSDYEKFMESTKEDLGNNFFSEDSSFEEKVDILDKGQEMVKESFSKLGVSEEAVELAHNVSKNTLKAICRTPNLFNFVQQFKDKCNDEFIRSALVGYTTTCMINTFDWKSWNIQEKTSMAATLCDILLDKSDFEELSKHRDNPKKLSNKIYNHPVETVKMLTTGEDTSWISHDTLTIIEQHHERPDGSGFPQGINYRRVTLLTAIFIIAFDFIELMLENNFDFQKSNEIITTLANRYYEGNYLKAMQALNTMLGI